MTKTHTTKACKNVVAGDQFNHTKSQTDAAEANYQTNALGQFACLAFFTRPEKMGNKAVVPAQNPRDSRTVSARS